MSIIPASFRIILTSIVFCRVVIILGLVIIVRMHLYLSYLRIKSMATVLKTCLKCKANIEYRYSHIQMEVVFVLDTL